jgi:uncharacterized protein (TIRG00374 family)
VHARRTGHNQRTKAAPSTPPPTPPADRLRSFWTVGRIVRYVIGLGLAGLAFYVLSGKTDELSGATGYLEDLRWYWLAVAAIAEAASIASFAALQRRLLAAGNVNLGMRPMTGITLAGNAIQNSLPAGTLFSAVFSFRQFHRRGADEVLAGWTLLGTAALSLITLVVLAGIGLSAATGTGTALDLVEVISGMIVLAGLLVLLWAKREKVARLLVRPLQFAQRIIHRPTGDIPALVETALERMSSLSPSRTDWAMAASYAMANWLFDAACLVVAFVAVGVSVPWRALFLAYAAAQLAANLPITPGGLGVVEGSLTIALVAFGGGKAETVAAVLLYRLISFWALLPVGWISWAIVSWDARHKVAVPLVAEVGTT